MPEDATAPAVAFRPRFVLYARGLAAVIILAAFALGIWGREIGFLILAGILCLPYLLFVAMPSSEKSAAWGRAIGWIGIPIVLVLAAFVWSPANPSAAKPHQAVIVVTGLFLAMQVGLLALLDRTTVHSFRRTLLVGMGYYVLIAVLITWEVSGLSDTSPLPRNESYAIGSLRTINTGAITYASVYPNVGFPPDLHSLGPAPAGGKQDQSAAGLLELELACGQPPCVKRGYRFEYHVQGKEAYSDDARPVRYQKTGLRSFFTDQTGVIRFTNDDRAATAKDSPIN